MGRALLLNASFEPLCVVSARRAVVLVLKEKAEIVERNGAELRSERAVVPVPSVIRLAHFVRVPYRTRVPLSRRAVFARDGHRCQYCNRAAENIDHVLPRSRGGAPQLGQRRRVVPPVQRPQGGPPPAGGRAPPPPRPRASRTPTSGSSPPPARSTRPGRPTSRAWRPSPHSVRAPVGGGVVRTLRTACAASRRAARTSARGRSASGGADNSPRTTPPPTGSRSGCAAPAAPDDAGCAALVRRSRGSERLRRLVTPVCARRRVAAPCSWCGGCGCGGRWGAGRAFVGRVGLRGLTGGGVGLRVARSGGQGSARPSFAGGVGRLPRNRGMPGGIHVRGHEGFLGEFQHSLDAKGRVILPVDSGPLADGAVIGIGQQQLPGRVHAGGVGEGGRGDPAAVEAG